MFNTYDLIVLSGWPTICHCIVTTMGAATDQSF